MHILLTDKLVCPRCGPGFGLILLADVVRDRRVEEGRLGCSNCREAFPIRGGVADLRLGPEAARSVPAQEADDESALRLAALMGLAEGGGMALVAGAAAQLVDDLAALVPAVEVVSTHYDAAAAGAPSAVSRVAAGGTLPFANASFRAAASVSRMAASLPELVRVLAPGGRLVITAADADTEGRLQGYDAQILLRQDDVVVAEIGR